MYVVNEQTTFHGNSVLNNGRMPSLIANRSESKKTHAIMLADLINFQVDYVTLAVHDIPSRRANSIGIGCNNPSLSDYFWQCHNSPCSSKTMAPAKHPWDELGAESEEGLVLGTSMVCNTIFPQHGHINVRRFARGMSSLRSRY